jgi:hypothetical protein
LGKKFSCSDLGEKKFSLVEYIFEFEQQQELSSMTGRYLGQNLFETIFKSVISN